MPATHETGETAVAGELRSPGQAEEVCPTKAPQTAKAERRAELAPQAGPYQLHLQAGGGLRAAGVADGREYSLGQRAVYFTPLLASQAP